MEEMNVSLVVPVKNEEASIRALLDSVLGQTIVPAEVLIVDGGSSDRTVEIVREYSSVHPSVQVIASSLLKKLVWQAAGGFSDQRAAEDLEFMETVESLGFKSARAPRARIWWQMQPTVISTFRRFKTYSYFNILADRQRDWHYCVARMYLAGLPFVALSLLSSPWWLAIPT